MCIIVDTSPYSCNVEAEKLWDSQGISSPSVMVSIAAHVQAKYFTGKNIQIYSIW